MINRRWGICWSGDTYAPAHFEVLWWEDLDGSKPVVLVTQGTIANFNMNELTQPTMDALANVDVPVVITTGRPDFASLVIP